MTNLRIPRVASVVVMTASIIVLLCSVWHWHNQQRLHRAKDSVTSMQRMILAARSSVATGAKLDYAERLPRNASVEPVVRELQRASMSVGVMFVSVSAVTYGATAQTIGRVDIAVTLRGAYPQVKAVLGDGLERIPSLILQRLTLRRASVPTELEAHVDFALASRRISPIAMPGAFTVDR
jgi:hypothetical protein